MHNEGQSCFGVKKDSQCLSLTALYDFAVGIIIVDPIKPAWHVNPLRLRMLV